MFYARINKIMELGRVEFANVSNQDTPEKSLLTVTASSQVRSRYLKIVFPDSRSNSNISISEIYVSGR
jgi:hypothetical protein